MILIYTQMVFPVLWRPMFTHPLVVTQLLTSLTVEADQFTVRSDHHHSFVIVCISHKIIGRIQLVIAIAEVKMVCLLGVGVIVI